MEPLNYIRDVANPMRMALQGYSVGAGDRMAREGAATQKEQFAAQQGLAQQRFGLDQQRFGLQEEQFRAQQSELVQKKAKAEAMQADLAALSQKIETGEADVRDFLGIATRNPELASSMKTTFDLMNGEQQKTSLLSMAQIYSAITSGNTDAAKTMLEDRLTAAENSGDEEQTTTAKAALGLINLSPNAAASILGVSLKVLGGDTFDTLLGGDKALKSEILADGTTIQATQSGVRVIAPNGDVLTGQAASDRIAEANAAGVELARETYGGRRIGTLEADIALAGTAAATVKSGEIAQTKGSEAFDQIGKVRTSIANINDAIAAIDAGADAGIVYNRLPNITKASAALSNALDRMGLDIISATTFGALSEGELKLAMETAAPRNLGPAEVKSWLEAKAQAQEKVAAMLMDTAVFLSTPGNTLADWVEKNRAETDGDDTAFMRSMSDKSKRGEAFSPDEIARMKIIAGSQ